jgi:hypothetical protein
MPVYLFFHDVRTGNVCRHQVGCELDATEFQVQCLAQGADQHRLAQPRDTFKQGVSPRKDGNEDMANHVSLAHNNLTHLRFYVGGGPAKGVN